MNAMKINVVKNVLETSETLAEENRQALAAAGVIAINMMSAPGSGKTTLLQKTIPAMTDRRCAVLVGDLQTSRDAQRLGDVGADVVQINTGRGCHLSPAEVAEGMKHLDLPSLDILFIENVGNMVCPAAFDLGEHLRVILLSTPEGDDKVAKYPTLFQQADAILLTKMDLAEILEYNKDQPRQDLAHINTRAPLMELSVKDGTGLDAWLTWLQGQQQ
jgi:hydrogenase nickel incorporation protein HypB